MASITINSIIANQTQGPPTPVSGQASVRPPAPPAEAGAVFTRTEPWRNHGNGQTRTSYTRADATGQKKPLPAAGAGPQPEQAADAGAIALPKTDPTTEQTPQDSVKKPTGELLTKSEIALLRELQKADQSVKAHEMAHLAAAGGYAKGGASFTYQRGPDGQNYAIGGEVQVDTGKEATPAATIQKMQIVRQAALAPIDPSPQDQQVAAHATLQLSEAFKELQLAQSGQQTTPPPQESTDDQKDTVQGIYRAAGQDLGMQVAAEGRANLRKSYQAYTKPFPPPVRPAHQGLDRTA